jgi:hypothetical protein
MLIRTHGLTVSRAAVDVSEEDELYPESPIAASERVRQLTTIKEVLTASELGTS